MGGASGVGSLEGRNRMAEDDELTPFAELIQDYMWRQRPPLSASKFAHRLGVAKGTVWNWLHARRLPPPSVLAMIHQKTGIALRDLYEAAGYPLPSAQVDDLVRQLPTMTSEERERLRAALNAVDDYLSERATARPAPAESRSEEPLDATRDQPGRRKRDSGAPKVLAGAR